MEPATKPTLQENLRWLVLGFVALWLFYFLFFFIIGFLAQWFPQLVSEELRQESILELLRNEPVRLVVMAVVIAPIFEEVLFRSLVRPSYGDLLLFMSGAVSLGFLLLLGEISSWYVRGSIVFFIFIGSYYFLQELFSKRMLARVQVLLGRITVPLLIASALLFGLVHVYNYVETFLLTSALMVAIVPRIALGGVAGWLKWKTGALLWPILLHFLNNAIVILFLLVSRYAVSA